MVTKTNIGPAWSLQGIRTLLTRTYREWSEVDAPRMGASLAFYTILSLAPLLLVLIGVAGLVFGREEATGALLSQIQSLVGNQGAESIRSVLQAASQKRSSGTLATVIGFATLLFGASSVALELRSAMDKIWLVKAEEGLAGFIKARSYAVGIVLGAGFLLLASLAISAALATMGKFLGGLLPEPAWLLESINVLISLIVIAGILGCLFKFLPSLRISWRDVIPGTIFTAILFTAGKTLIGIYLGKAAVGSAYGAAGSLIILLIWIYYSAQIVFFGAEFTRIYSQEYGSQPKTEEKAKVNCQRELTAPSAASAAEDGGGADLRSSSATLVGNVAHLLGLFTGFGIVTVKIFHHSPPEADKAIGNKR